MAEALTEPISTIATPGEIFNCPNCSVWLQPGTLVCPECETIVYSQHLREIALAATAEETAGNWIPAREVWRQALDWLPPGTKQYVAVEQRIGLIDTRLKGAQDRKAKWTRRLGPLAPVVFFLAKLKTYFFLLLKFKFLLSFLGFFAIYWALFGLPFGLGFTVSILIHEMGHYVAARRRGLKVDLPVFLPGLGAYVRWYAMGISLDDLSGIALAGPFFGLTMSVVFGVIARLLHDSHAAGLFSALGTCVGVAEPDEPDPGLRTRRRAGYLRAEPDAALAGDGDGADLLRAAARVDVPGDRVGHGLEAVGRRLCGEAKLEDDGAVCAAAICAWGGGFRVPGYDAEPALTRGESGGL